MADSGQHRTWRADGAMALLILRESLKSFSYNRAIEKAATLSYYSFFAMIPLLLILVFAVSTVIASSDRALTAIASATAGVSPAFSKAILEEVGQLARQRAWGVVSLLVLFWSVTPLTGAIRSAFSAIFMVPRRLPFLKSKLRDGIAVLMLLALLILFVSGRSVSLLIESNGLSEWSGLLRTGSALIRVLMATACACLFYVALLPTRLRFSLVLTGALLTTLLLEFIGPLFGLILRFNPNYGYAFGSMKAIFLLFVWVYYSFAAVLFATEVMANIRRRDLLVLKDLFLHPGARRYGVLLNRFSRSYQPGQSIFREGDGGSEMFCLLDGSVRLTHGETLLREMNTGDYFGEMAMLLGAPRTASAEAGAAGAVLATVSAENFEVVLRENPGIVMSILKELAQRLKATNERQSDRSSVVSCQ